MDFSSPSGLVKLVSHWVEALVERQRQQRRALLRFLEPVVRSHRRAWTPLSSRAHPRLAAGQANVLRGKLATAMSGARCRAG